MGGDVDADEDVGMECAAEEGNEAGTKEVVNSTGPVAPLFPLLLLLLLFRRLFDIALRYFYPQIPAKTRRKLWAEEGGAKRQRACDRRGAKEKKQKKGGLRLRERSSNFTSNTPKSRVQTTPNILAWEISLAITRPKSIRPRGCERLFSRPLCPFFRLSPFAAWSSSRRLTDAPFLLKGSFVHSVSLKHLSKAWTHHTTSLAI